MLSPHSARLDHGWLAAVLLISCFSAAAWAGSSDAVLDPEDYRHHVERFNRLDDEKTVNAIPNARAWEWMRENVPLFECPRRSFEEIYYFRWWSLRKHIKRTPQGLVMDEFLVPRSYADRYNMISCALGHHIYEARWLRDESLLDDYVHVWYRGNDGGPMERLHSFSGWTADALYQRYLVNLDRSFLVDLLDDLAADYARWEDERQLPDGLFWQYDVRDGMEESISGGRRARNTRPTINSYMYGNARALEAIATLAGRPLLAERYDARARRLKALVQKQLWDREALFFKVRLEDGRLSDAREAIGFIPWYFRLPDPGYEAAWRQLTDPEGFWAPHGLTTAERRHPAFRSHGCCRCEWDGAVWPFATSQTLTALANLLEHYEQRYVTATDYFRALQVYAESHVHRDRPYIGEYLDETTGRWLKGDEERSRYYNHSTFCDLVITGLAGLRPRSDTTLVLRPLIPVGTWDWFCLDRVSYHGRTLTILWDRTGERYGRGAGLQVLADGRSIAWSPELQPLAATLPPRTEEQKPRSGRSTEE